MLGGGVEASSGPAEGEAWDGNSLMVTVSRLVVTSVTTTSVQLGAISGRQPGSPSAGTLWDSAGGQLGSLWPPAGGRFALSRWEFFLPSRGEEEGSRAHSSFSPSTEEDGEEGREAGAGSPGGAGALDSGHGGRSAAALAGDVPPELLELEGDGGLRYWAGADRASLGAVLEHVAGEERKDRGQPYWSPNGFPYMGKPSIFRGGWKGL